MTQSNAKGNIPAGTGFVHTTSGGLDGNAISISGDVTCTTGSDAVVVGLRTRTLASSLSSVGAAQDGYLLTWINANNDWEAKPNSFTGSITLNGDVTGSSSANTVVALRGKSLDSSLATVGASQDGYVLTWVNGSVDWQAKPITLAVGGDLSGNLPNPTVIGLRGKLLDSSLATIGASQDGYVLTWVNSASDWQAKKPAAGGSNGTTSTQTTDYSILTTDYQILCNFGAGHSLTLPAPSNGAVYHVWDISGTAETNNITLVRHGTEKISGIAASRILSTNWGHWMITSDGTDWYVG